MMDVEPHMGISCTISDTMAVVLYIESVMYKRGIHHPPVGIS